MTATVEVAAAGAAALLPVCRITNAARALQQLKEVGYWTVGLIARSGIDLYQFDPPERVVVVVGGETGMRPLVAKHCDFARFHSHARQGGIAQRVGGDSRRTL